MAPPCDLNYGSCQVIPGLSIGELADETATPISTLRFYERKGLLAAPPRESGKRRYPPDAPDRVRLVRMWRNAGFSLGEIDQLLTDREHLDLWKELVRTKISELNVLAAEVERSRLQLEHALLCRAPDWTACPTMKATARGEPALERRRSS
jgi:DNA-binding transcriptional MerR regulator